MAVLYIDEYGATLRATHERLIVEKDDAEIAAARPQELELVIVFASCGFTSSAAQLLLRHDVDVVFLDYHEEYLGRLEGAAGKNILLRRRQYALSDDLAFCLSVARAVTRGKLANMRTILMRYGRAGVAGVETGVSRMKEALDQVDTFNDLQALLGLEGTASAEYFNALGAIIEPPFTFAARNRRPPRDPVNAMLGFAYALLNAYVARAVSAVGLDAYCGFYHREVYGRMSLALDLMEEWRPVLADSVVVSCCNRDMLDPAQDFEARDGGVFLNERGRQTFLRRFHARMKETVDAGPAGTLPYERVLVVQAQSLAAYIRTGEPQYMPFLVK